MKCALVPVTAYQQNCSVLLCEETGKAAVVDPGGDIERIEGALAQLGGELEVILLTHGHMDHCAAADVLRQKYGVKIIGPQKEDAFWIDKLPEWCQMSGFPHADAFTPDRWLEDGDTVSFGAQTMSVLHCPGHTPGHVVFYHAPSKLALVGDVLFQGSIGRTDFPRGDYDTLITSIREKLWPLGDDITFVPGHGPTSTFGAERQSNPFVADSRYG
ncbi:MULTISPECIES: MBL fold metallo-hydrolase [Spongiibacter]|uniref:MBL fold metallo-hydrolase n=1 Tax=Spongiibacter TaxID=630749 RepID=UPI000C60C9C1|nr:MULTISPECIES: MBL fold metallo-hydrolase [Spongiibacter]MAY39336.1 MBL fold metallo-hydrolase [Spongiibacter sp.]MBI58954.1 MBL fold metallo-hydrolase [Spongiibacter sp.]MBO6752425.1 MBL fold metallo-hydrolase [Spongiibacter sp.]MBU72571.1 MBL fold metallo-hydrolase [Spongiibacter sp.]|tara:strand:- start:28248 stop:28892 length:645 start_codon:yes stop_codon:yes gene_type:complete